MLSAEQIVSNYEQLISIINKNFSGERQEKLLKIYEQDFKERIMYAPASAKVYYHSAFPGGYIYHVLNVIKNTMLISEVWTVGNQVKDYTDEEAIFSALNHDLGKLGTIHEPYYLQSTQKWKLDRGEPYEFNDNLVPYMPVHDRSLFHLQSYGIEVTPTEFLSIKLHDGLYDEGNKIYYVSYSEYKQLKTNLPYILHQADLMATRIEYNEYKSGADTSPGKTFVTNPIKKSVPKKYEDALKSIFGE